MSKLSQDTIRAVIIDDEERAINTLRSLLNLYIPEVEIIATSQSVPDGVLAINQHRPQLVFLDIEMPEYNGFELLNFFRDIDFEIIFVTAYNEYAIRAFEISAIDYLLKPVDIDKLKAAIDKARGKLLSSNMQAQINMLKENLSGQLFTKIALPMADGLLFVETSEIAYMEADGAYTNIWLKENKKIVVSKKIKFFEEVLEHHPAFFRTHRSYIVNINYIQKYIKSENSILLENNQFIVIARDRKADFEQQLRDNQVTLK